MNSALFFLALAFTAVSVNASSAHFGYPYFVGMTDNTRLAIIEAAKNSVNTAVNNVRDAVPPSDQCNFSQFVTLLNQFVVDAGFDKTLNYTNNGDNLVDQVNALFNSLDTSTDATNAAATFDKFCVAQRQFFNQLDLSQIEGCIDAPALVSWGYDNVQAVKTVQFFSQVNYQCTDGFRTYISKFLDYLRAYAANLGILNNCEKTFNTSLKNAISSTDTCAALDAYGTCVGQVYKNVSIDQAWTSCEVVRTTNLVVLHECIGIHLCQLSAFT